MTVYKHREVWKVDIYVNGKRIIRKSGFKRKSEADDFERTILQRYRENPDEFRNDQRGKYTYEALLARFKSDHLSTLASGTQRRYTLDIDQRITPHFQFMQLSRITSEMIEGFRASLLGTMEPKSINNCTDLLRSMLNCAYRWDMIKENPYRLKKLKVPRSREKQFWDSKEHVARFLYEAKLRSRYYAAFLLALETGMRLAEIVGLSKRDINFETGQIYVWRQWVERANEYAPLKDNEERYAYFDPNGELARALKDAVRASAHPEAIFVSVKGHRVSNRDLGRRYFKNICRKAGVPVISFHGLRHTYASWFMIEHDEIWALKSALGHSDIKTTQIYAHHSPTRKGKVLSFTPKSPPDSLL